MRLYKSTTAALLCLVYRHQVLRVTDGFTFTATTCTSTSMCTRTRPVTGTGAAPRRRTFLPHPLASSIPGSVQDVVSQELLLVERAVLTSTTTTAQELGRTPSDEKKSITLGSSLPWLGGSLLLAVAATTSHLLPAEILHNNPVTHAAPILLAHLPSLPSLAWDSYQSVLARHPIATKAATSACVYALGDLLAQTSTNSKNNKEHVQDGPRPLDMARILKSFVAGGVGHGPLSHVWYNVSEEFFHNIVHWTAWWSFVPKIVVDQAVWGPIWTTIYLGMIGMMNRESFPEIKTNVQTSLLPLVVDGLKLWPLAHCVTYGLIPVEHRLLWVDLVEILWVSILANAAAAAAPVTTPSSSLVPPQQQQAEDERLLTPEPSMTSNTATGTR
jgi:protein Mpv17